MTARDPSRHEVAVTLRLASHDLIDAAKKMQDCCETDSLTISEKLVLVGILKQCSAVIE
jgi:hypothetical protein